MIIEIFATLICLFLIYGLFLLGQSKHKNIFYTLIFLPYIPLCILLFLTFMSLNLFSLILILIIIIERILWGISLKEASDENKIVWFYLIYLIPIIGWVLYHITKI